VLENYQDVLDQLRAYGLIVESLRIGEARPVRCKVEGDREKRGWYILHELPLSEGGSLIVGSYGMWRGNENHAQKIELKRDNPLSDAQRDALRQRLAEDRKRAEQALAQQHAKAAARAELVWAKLARDGDSPYLAAKHVQAYDLRFTPNGSAVVPLMDTAGRVHGLQFLRTAAQAKQARRHAKEFWPAGLAKKGHFHLIGSPAGNGIVLVGEGYATCASKHAATGLPVAVAFDAGNILPVVTALRKRYKLARILICGDDDLGRKCPGCKGKIWLPAHPKLCPHCGIEHKAKNDGLEAASAAAMAVDGAYVLPRFADNDARRAAYEERGEKISDFNDLHAIEGLSAVRQQIEARLSELKWSVATPRASSSTTGGEGERFRPIQYLDELIGRFALVYAMAGAVFDHKDRVLLPLTDMRNACIDSSLHKAWMEHPERQIVRKAEVGFDPTERNSAITCNLWAGWPTQPQAGNCSKLVDLLHYMCSGDRNAATLANWVLKWIAYPIQHPGAKMRTCVVVHGPQGTGKNLFFEAVMEIYGRYGLVLDQVALSDKHNDWASGKLFVVADEVVAQADRFDLKNRLKGLITGKHIRINPKHIAAYDESNHLNMVFLSNEAMPVVLEEDDRRHCVIWTPEKRPPEFYTGVQAEIDAGGVSALHDYLLRVDLGDFHPATNPPDTAAKRELISLGLDSPLQFVDALQTGDIPQLLRDKQPIPGLTADWYSAYCHWCTRVGVKPASMKRFVNAIERKRGMPSERKRWMGPAGEPAGPHCMFLWGRQQPEGSDQTTWLGDQVRTLRDAIANFRGHHA
jgi:putative DNA primase/helicase